MNNLAWQAGKNLRRAVEQTGRSIILNHWIVATWMIAQEEGVDIGTLMDRLYETKDFAPAPTNAEEIKRQLGY